MSDCKHEDFDARVEVARISDDGTGEDIIHFILEVELHCANCGQDFGFRGPPAGVSWTEPRCTVDARKVHLPLISPAELELLPPLAALDRGPMIYEAAPRSSVSTVPDDQAGEES